MSDAPASKPKMVFITGGNGAGKSSLWEEMKKTGKFDGYDYLNVDDKFAELKRQNQNAPTLRDATDWRNAEMNRLIAEGKPFVAETVFDEGKLGYLKRARKNGFETTVIFIGLESPELAVERVQYRASTGKHFVPDKTVAARWEGSLRVVDKAITRADVVQFLDNTAGGDPQREVAMVVHGNVVRAPNNLPSWTDRIPTLKSKIAEFHGQPPTVPPNEPDGITENRHT